VRVFHLTQGETRQNTQEIINLIRTNGGYSADLFPYTARRAIALRGTPAQIALAEWLIGELDKAGTPQANTTDAYEHPAPSAAAMRCGCSSSPRLYAGGPSGHDQPDSHDGGYSADVPLRRP